MGEKAIYRDHSAKRELQASEPQPIQPATKIPPITSPLLASPESPWQRCTYSSVGPGRSPGLVKPDFVEFGGCLQRPFIALSDGTVISLEATEGTSFSAPSGEMEPAQARDRYQVMHCCAFGTASSRHALMKTIPKLAHGDRRRNPGLRPRFRDTERGPRATHARVRAYFVPNHEVVYKQGLAG